MEYGYVRVSSKDQNIDRQMNAMKQYHIDKKRYMQIINQVRISIDYNIKNL